MASAVLLHFSEGDFSLRPSNQKAVHHLHWACVAILCTHLMDAVYSKLRPVQIATCRHVHISDLSLIFFFCIWFLLCLSPCWRGDVKFYLHFTYGHANVHTCIPAKYLGVQTSFMFGDSVQWNSLLAWENKETISEEM